MAKGPTGIADPQDAGISRDSAAGHPAGQCHENRVSLCQVRHSRDLVAEGKGSARGPKGKQQLERTFGDTWGDATETGH